MLLVEAGGGEDDADQDTQVHETVTAATDGTPQPTTYTLYIVINILKRVPQNVSYMYILECLKRQKH